MTVKNFMETLASENQCRTIYVGVSAEAKQQTSRLQDDIKLKPQKWGAFTRPNYYPIPSKRLKQFIRERDNYTCQLCGKPNCKHVDHIVPLEESHDNSPENLRVLCHRCNIIRGNRFCKPRSSRLKPVDNTAVLLPFSDIYLVNT